MGPKYPDVHARPRDGNAFSILSAVDKGLRDAGVSEEERNAFYSEATSGDYNNLLATAMKWVDLQPS